MSEEFEAPDAAAPADDEAADESTVELTDQPADTTEVETRAAPERTGNHDVDRVLASLDGLDEKPVDEHVAVFERAHENLRGALDGPRPPRP